MIGAYNSFYEAAGQLIFLEPAPIIKLKLNTTNCAEITYHSQNSSLYAKMLVGVVNVEDLSYPYEVKMVYSHVFKVVNRLKSKNLIEIKKVGRKNVITYNNSIPNTR